MDQQHNQPGNSNLFSLSLDGQNSYTLRSVASWAKVLGVVSIILAILCLVMGVMAQQSTNSYRSYRSSGINAVDLGNMGLAVMVITALIYGIGGMFALNAGNKINVGLRTNNMEALNSGFAGARNFFALWAILLIIFLVLMLIGFLGRA
jgi:hypothetical protein